MREALSLSEVHAELHVVSDGENAFNFIDASDSDAGAPCPALILLDLNLPKRTGLEVLQHIRRSKSCAHALVLIVTSSDSRRDRLATSQLGANGYFCKPSDYEAYLTIGEIIHDLLRNLPPPMSDTDRDDPQRA